MRATRTHHGVCVSPCNYAVNNTGMRGIQFLRDTAVLILGNYFGTYLFYFYQTYVLTGKITKVKIITLTNLDTEEPST